MIPRGAIDCDVHPAVPNLRALLPYLNGHWRDTVVQRGVHELDAISYPLNSPLASRPDWRRDGKKPGADFDRLRIDALDGFGVDVAICNCLYGVNLLFSEDMSAAFATAVNDFLAREWLDRDKRLRASMVIPFDSPSLAVAEIERRAEDPRFVQVLVPLMGETPLGRRAHWPIYEAAQKAGLPIGIHAGSTYRHPVTPVGWPSYFSEDYAAQATGFQSQLTSLICEGVFSRFRDLRVVLIESGFTWLPAFIWRLSKFWRGLRMEVPWVDRAPGQIVRDHVRLTLQPVDGPPDPAALARVIDQMGSEDLLLFSTDYPHWQFDGDAALPDGISDDLARKIMVDNPRATYPRLRETVA